MLDKSKARIDTCRDTPNSDKESRMPATDAKSVANRVAESEIEQVAKSASSNEEISEKVKLSIAASRQGRVVSRQKAIERLKKRAS
jgi:hypothetical protein